MDIKNEEEIDSVSGSSYSFLNVQLSSSEYSTDTDEDMFSFISEFLNKDQDPDRSDDISQNNLLDNIKQYLLNRGRLESAHSTAILLGSCVGFSILFLYFVSRDQSDQYFDMIDLILILMMTLRSVQSCRLELRLKLFHFS